MTWLAHHEFGLDHRAFQFDDTTHDVLTRLAQEIEYPHLDEALTYLNMDLLSDAQEIVYWVLRWIEAYDFVYRQWQKHPQAQLILVSYESLTSNTSTVINRLLQHIHIPLAEDEIQSLAQQIKAAPQRTDLWPTLHEDPAEILIKMIFEVAYSLYRKLNTLAIVSRE